MLEDRKKVIWDDKAPENKELKDEHIQELLDDQNSLSN